MPETNGPLTGNQRAFLAAYAQTGNISHAARLAGLARTNHYLWSAQSPDYREAFGAASEEAADHLEAEARRRAVEGVKRLKFHKGKPIIDPATKEPYFEHDYSDLLLIFLLKAVRPEKFRDNHHVVMNGKLEHRAKAEHEGQLAPIQFNWDAVPLEARLAVLEEYQRQQGQLNGRNEAGESGMLLNRELPMPVEVERGREED